MLWKKLGKVEPTLPTELRRLLLKESPTIKNIVVVIKMAKGKIGG
jgi:hypothetical protein